jgi:ABC-2 type transport system permease protein
MMNLIRADIYRIFRGKGIYITLAIFMGIIVLQVVAGAYMNAGIRLDDFEMIDSLGEPGITFVTHNDNEPLHNDEESSLRPFGAEAPYLVMGFTDGLLYILLPLLIFISTADFTSGAVKNTLVGGMTRLRYYFTKLALSCMASALLLFAYVLISTIVATAFSGFGGTLDWEYISSVLKVFAMQLWLVLAVTCVGHFFIFIIRSGMVIGVFIAFLLAPSLVIFLLSFINRWFENLLIYDLTMGLAAVLNISVMPTGDIIKTILVGAGYIAAATVGGYMLFRRAEIK